MEAQDIRFKAKVASIATVLRSGVWQVVKARVQAFANTDAASLDIRRDWHPESMFQHLLDMEAASCHMPLRLASITQHRTGREVVSELRGA